MRTTLSATTPLAERAKALVPLLDSHASYGDVHSQLATEVVDAYLEAGLLKMWVPEELGGYELGPRQSLEVLALTAYADPSAGWVQMAASLAIGTAGSYLGETAVKELFGSGRCPVIAGQGTAPGTAKSVNGGFLLSGSWSFASGLLHGDHIHTLGIIEETGEPRIFVVPVEKAELFPDSWEVMGLRGTGSIDYTITNTFVPEDFTHFAFTREPRHGGSLYRLGIIGIAVVCHSGWAMGVGRRLLDELSELVRTKTGRAGSLVESDAFRTDFAKSEARFRAAVAFVNEAWADVESSVEAGREITVRQDTLIRIALGNITGALADVANFVYLSGGTTALRKRSPIERLVRDVHAGTQHITSGPGMWRAAGEELVGAGEKKHWVLLDLVDTAPPA
jgi:alkylation response protein AidB-like acyl-CoA dehydrogenase